VGGLAVSKLRGKRGSKTFTMNAPGSRLASLTLRSLTMAVIVALIYGMARDLTTLTMRPWKTLMILFHAPLVVVMVTSATSKNDTSDNCHFTSS
jgi:hypothetical protein